MYVCVCVCVCVCVHARACTCVCISVSVVYIWFIQSTVLVHASAHDLLFYQGRVFLFLDGSMHVVVVGYACIASVRMYIIPVYTTATYFQMLIYLMCAYMCWCVVQYNLDYKLQMQSWFPVFYTYYILFYILYFIFQATIM